MSRVWQCVYICVCLCVSFLSYFSLFLSIWFITIVHVYSTWISQCLLYILCLRVLMTERETQLGRTDDPMAAYKHGCRCNLCVCFSDSRALCLPSCLAVGAERQSDITGFILRGGNEEEERGIKEDEGERGILCMFIFFLSYLDTFLCWIIYVCGFVFMVICMCLLLSLCVCLCVCSCTYVYTYVRMWLDTNMYLYIIHSLM